MKIHLISFPLKEGGKYWLSAAWGLLPVSSLPMWLRDKCYLLIRYHVRENQQNQSLPMALKHLDSKRLTRKQRHIRGNSRNMLKGATVSGLVFKYFDKECRSSLLLQYLDSQVTPGQGSPKIKSKHPRLHHHHVTKFWPVGYMRSCLWNFWEESLKEQFNHLFLHPAPSSPGWLEWLGLE